MVDESRLEDLRRRVEKDPASIAFAQLAEEYRRAGRYVEAVAACRVGLARHPGYLSARVTSGRALIELGQLDEAQQEFERVLRSSPENLAALRGLAEIHHKRGALPEALTQYKAALSLARNDPELEETVNDLARRLGPLVAPESTEGLSFEQMRTEIARHPPYTPEPVPGPQPQPVEEAPVAHARAVRTVAVLEEWLRAIHVARTEQRA